MLGAPKDVREILLNTPDEKSNLISFLKPGSIVIDHTSSSPDLAIEISNYTKSKSIVSIDAPVTGGDLGAKNGTLALLCGCDNKEDLDRVQDILSCYSKKVTHFGKAGSGHQAKMANQICVAQTMVGVAESLMYGYTAGLDLELMLNTIRPGAAGSFCMDVMGTRIVEGDYHTGGAVYYLVKDLGIALDEARKLNMCLPGTALALNLYSSVMANGGPDISLQGLIDVLAQINNKKFDLKK